MTEVRPFRALRYDPKQVELARVLVPPYDVVTPAERERFWQRDPHNAIRLELTRTPDEEGATDYASVRDTLDAWRREGVLRRDAEPAFYVLRQRFEAPGGEPVARVGFFASLQLEDYAARVVRPHERTMSGPKQDRLKLLRATRANLSPIFLLYEDRESALQPLLERALAGAEALTARDEAGVEHTLAPLREPEATEKLQRFLAGRPTVIADGHHRYETALAYRDERRAGAGDEPAEAEPAYERTLAYFANAWAEGSLLLPIHRVIRKGPAPTDAAWRERLPGWEEVARVEVADAAAVPDALASALAPRSDRHAFAADDGSGTLRIFARAADRELTVRVLHREVIEGVFGLDDEAVREGAVAFPKSALETARQVRAGEGAVALYLNPLTPDDVFRVTEAGEILPQKSTFFFPKLPSGLVFRALEDEVAR